MASQYVFSNYALQFLASQVATRFRIYAAVYNPIQIKTVSQDIQTDEFGQYTNVNNLDLLGGRFPPYAPQANLGANRIGFVNERLFFDGSRSTQRNNLSAVGHTWTATGSPTIRTYNHLGEGDQAQITWANPGIYTVKLAVSDRFGGTMTATRQVWIYQDRDTTPQGAISLSGMTGSIESGGWQSQFTTTRHSLNILLPDALPIGYYQPITLMCETEYEIAGGIWVPAQIGPYGAPVPGQFYDDPRILFAGYIQAGSADEDSEKDTVTYSLQTVQMILQQGGIHNIGYYNATYNTRQVDGTPASQNPPPNGWKGQVVTDLTSEDIYRSLLSGYMDDAGNSFNGHSNIGQYHDLIIWRDFLPVPNPTNFALYFLTYSHLTANEGTLWDACTTLAKNEYSDIWCERNGMICIGPTLNMRGYEMMQTPTDYPLLPLSQILPFNTELNKDKNKAARQAYLHYLLGPNPLPVHQDFLYSASRDLSALLGPPIVAHISDVAVYDSAANPPDQAGLFSWVQQNWPQDLAIHPISTTIDENYTQRDSFVKVVATLVTGQTVWAAWYPLNTFDSTGLMLNAMPTGTWDVQDSLLLADITAAANKTLSWQYLWELTRRIYLARNAQYVATIHLGMAAWPRLHDLFLFTRQNVQGGPKLSGIPMYITDLTFNINLDQQQWLTDIKANMVTSYFIGPIVTPPFPPPK
jgi:hypothetical protein